MMIRVLKPTQHYIAYRRVECAFSRNAPVDLAFYRWAWRIYFLDIYIYTFWILQTQTHQHIYSGTLRGQSLFKEKIKATKRKKQRRTRTSANAIAAMHSSVLLTARSTYVQPTLRFAVSFSIYVLRALKITEGRWLPHFTLFHYIIQWKCSIKILRCNNFTDSKE